MEEKFSKVFIGLQAYQAQLFIRRKEKRVFIH